MVWMSLDGFLNCCCWRYCRTTSHACWVDGKGGVVSLTVV